MKMLTSLAGIAAMHGIAVELNQRRYPELSEASIHHEPTAHSGKTKNHITQNKKRKYARQNPHSKYNK